MIYSANWYKYQRSLELNRYIGCKGRYKQLSPYIHWTYWSRCRN